MGDKEKIKELKKENKYLRDCVKSWKWCFNTMLEQNTKIIEEYLNCEKWENENE